MFFQDKFKKETHDFERYAEYIATYDQLDPRLLNIWLQKIREHQNPRDDHVLAQDVLPFDRLLNVLNRPRSYFELLRKTEGPSRSILINIMCRNNIIVYEDIDGTPIVFPLFDVATEF